MSDGVVLDEVGDRARALRVDGDAEPLDLRRVSERAVGDDAADSPGLRPREQDPARGRGPRLVAAVHHEDVAGRDVLDRLALRVVVVLEDVERVDVLAGGDVPEREGGTGHPVRRDGPDALQEDVAQPALRAAASRSWRCDRFEQLERAVVHGRCQDAGCEVAAQSSLVRGARPAVLRAPLADVPDGLRPGGLRRQARDRGREHVERDQPVPHASARRAPRTSSAASGRPAGFRWRCRRSR